MNVAVQTKRQLNQNGLSPDAFNITQVARFCSERLRDATDDLVSAYLTMGDQLAELQTKLKKTTPRGDNEHIGWRQAFQQKRPDGQLLFPVQTQDRRKIHQHCMNFLRPQLWAQNIPNNCHPA